MILLDAQQKNLKNIKTDKRCNLMSALGENFVNRIILLAHI